jgi:hypothetical protein
VAVEGASLQRYFHYFLFGQHLLSHAYFASLPLLNYLALALAGIACLLHLLVHTWSHLVHLNYPPLSLASLADLNSSSSLAAAGLTGPSAFVWNLEKFSIIALL